MLEVHEFVDEGLGHASYLIDVGDGTAAVIDPPRFTTAHESLAAQAGLRITRTLDTHTHADYVTGSPGLVTRLGVTFFAPAASELVTPHLPLSDGSKVELAEGVTIAVMATPGHTPDHHAYVLVVDDEPQALFSGGSLMVGTVGRTDLCGPQHARPLAHQMWHSLRRFDHLSEDLRVYPTHGAGSFCSGPSATARSSTLGHERATNPLFATLDEDDFVGRLMAGFGSFPSHFTRLPELNRLGPTRFDQLPTLAKLSVADLVSANANGAVVVDARPFLAFGTGHLPGSMSNTLRPAFASWLGWLIPAATPLVFVLDDDQDRFELVRQCLDVGHELLLGELAGGIGAWMADGRELASIDVVDSQEICGAIVDVRQAAEYATGHLPDAHNVELGSIAHPGVTGQAAFVGHSAVTLMCGHGERAMTAASILGRGGRAVQVFDGGPTQWASSNGRYLIVES